MTLKFMLPQALRDKSNKRLFGGLKYSDVSETLQLKLKDELVTGVLYVTYRIPAMK